MGDGAGEPDRVGWNDSSAEDVRKSFEDMIKNSFLDGSVQIETKSATWKGSSIYVCNVFFFFQIICDVAFSNMSDAILIGCKNNRDSIIECVRKSIIVLK